MWPFDTATSLTIAAAALCLLGAAKTSWNVRWRVTCVLLGAFLIRLDSARQDAFHAWDERFHVVVGKNLAAHPLKPMLYARPALDLTPARWTETDVWLHKPPLAMWLIAASVSMFGLTAVAARLPGILLSTASVALTFLTGRRLFGQRVALLGAALQAVSGLLVSLASGRRVADHVDTALIFCVQLGIHLALVSARHRSSAVGGIAGLALGAGILAKSLPAFIIPVVAIVLWTSGELPRRLLARSGWMLAGTVVVAAPWLIYAHLVFPAEAQASMLYTLRHMTEVMEGHGGPWWSYAWSLPRLFGPLIALPLAWFAWRTVRNPQPAHLALFVWIAVPIVTFSMMATKLPAFIAISAPALFVGQAMFWVHLRDRVPGDGWKRLALVTLLGLLIVSPAGSLLEATGPLEIRDRHPPAIRELRQLEQRLGLRDAAIFNLPMAIEAMFYSPYTAYDRLPRPEEIVELQRQHRPIVIYQPHGQEVDVPSNWRAIVLRGDLRR